MPESNFKRLPRKSSPHYIPSIREQLDKCKHFGGIGNDQNGNRLPLHRDDRGCCRAGVRYNDILKFGEHGGLALPCFHPERHERSMPKDKVWPTCPKQEFKTAAELDKEEAKHNETTAKFINRIAVARPAIIKHAKWETQGQNRRDAQGCFPCPICKTGTLHYTIAKYNGHVHAKCTTEGCCSWIE